MKIAISLLTLLILGSLTYIIFFWTKGLYVFVDGNKIPFNGYLILEPLAPLLIILLGLGSIAFAILFTKIARMADDALRDDLSDDKYNQRVTEGYHKLINSQGNLAEAERKLKQVEEIGVEKERAIAILEEEIKNAKAELKAKEKERIGTLKYSTRQRLRNTKLKEELAEWKKTKTRHGLTQ